MSVVQIFVIGAILFILYRFLLLTIGVEQLGIWSLIIATTSVTQIANFGLSGSVVKFVAKYIARGDNKAVSELIQTAVISALLFMGGFLIISFPILKSVLGFIIHEKNVLLAISILPYAFFSLWVMVGASIVQAGLDGYQRIDMRSFLLVGGSVFHLGLCFFLVPAYGLIGLAYAGVIHNSAVLIGSWVLLKRYCIILPIFPYKWNTKLFKEMVVYGVNFQTISIAAMLYDPTTKALLSKFGNLSMVGYYEMASKMVLQFRSLIVAANQVIVPVIADVKETAPDKIRSFYLISYQLLFSIAVPLYSLIIVFMPVISEVWIGHYEKDFVIFGMLLVAGWFLNTLSAPSYFSNLGIGELRWNVLAHVVIGILNVSVGFVLGGFLGGTGVVIAWTFSFAIGSSIIYVFYHLQHKISLTELLPRSSRMLVLSCLTGMISVCYLTDHLRHKNLSIITLTIGIFLGALITIFIPFWVHPLRKQVTEWIWQYMLKKEKPT
jgi:O-antigen/teichoic acid export membrane protein